MIKKTKQSKYFPLIIALCVIGAGMFASRAITKPSSDSSPPAFSSKTGNVGGVRSYWSKAIDQLGPTQTYTNFKENVRLRDTESQHVLAHIFGALLYEKAGAEGIGVCDGEFAFGCYHSFFGRAIADKGQAVVTSLDQACIKKFGPLGTGCQHGIGHGLMEYYGTKLDLALTGCLVTQKIALLGCTSGVFMEYNFPVITGSETATTSLRKLDPAQPYEPCPNTPAKFQKSCYFELPQWWYQVYERNDQVMGRLCQDISEQPHRENCFRGLGNTIGPRTNFDLKSGLDICRTMPSIEGNTLCLAGLSWSWFAEPSKRPVSSKPCQDLANRQKETCLKKSDLVSEVF